MINRTTTCRPKTVLLFVKKSTTTRTVLGPGLSSVNPSKFLVEITKLTHVSSVHKEMVQLGAMEIASGMYRILLVSTQANNEVKKMMKLTRKLMTSPKMMK